MKLWPSKQRLNGYQSFEIILKWINYILIINTIQFFNIKKIKQKDEMLYSNKFAVQFLIATVLSDSLELLNM